jgi:hypothetical protein
VRDDMLPCAKGSNSCFPRHAILNNLENTHQLIHQYPALIPPTNFM